MQVVISGYGRMGHMIEQVLRERGIECVAKSEDITGLDPALAANSICIDFTVPEAFRHNYEWLAKHFKGVVVGTTGWYDIKDEVFASFRKHETPLIWASNFSPGVNVLSAAVELVSRLLRGDGTYQPYIIEKHHIHKLDAPSGTAKTIAQSVEQYLGLKPEILSVRAGEIKGIHTIVFEGENERLTLEHEAFSRLGLAEGAVDAAVMIENVKGVHEFKSLFLEKLKK